MTKIQIIKDGVVIGDREITETQEEALAYAVQKAGSDKDGFTYLLDRVEDTYKSYESSYLSETKTEYFGHKTLRLPECDLRELKTTIDEKLQTLEQQNEN